MIRVFGAASLLALATAMPVQETAAQTYSTPHAKTIAEAKIASEGVRRNGSYYWWRGGCYYRVPDGTFFRVKTSKCR